jgi:hypothetical protein
MMLQPGQEVTRCVTAHLPTTAPVDVVRIGTRQRFTHHIIFYREEKDVPDQPLRNCPPLNIFGGTQVQRVPLFIGETPEAELRLPPGVAYPMAAGQAYTIEGHYFNPSGQPVETSAEVLLYLAPAGSKTTKANMLFYAMVSALTLPPRQVTTIRPGFRIPREGIKLFALTSHQHRLGIDFVISRSTGRDDKGEMLFRNQDWAHPPLLRFPDDRLLTFTGDEGLRWECTYDNTNDFTVKFGPSAERDEMCILWGYYFPSQGFDLFFE